MIYADTQYYEQEYLLGRKPRLPLQEFGFWEKKARQVINFYTFNRITEPVLEEYRDPIGQCACELAEFLYRIEGSENKQSESVSGWSVVYKYGEDYRICQKHLSGTGLMYRGQRYVSERRS